MMIGNRFARTSRSMARLSHFVAEMLDACVGISGIKNIIPNTRSVARMVSVHDLESASGDDVRHLPESPGMLQIQRFRSR